MRILLVFFSSFMLHSSCLVYADYEEGMDAYRKAWAAFAQ
jgi:hypothetical protein